MKKLIIYLTTFSISFTFSCIFYLLFSFMNIFHSFDEKILISMLFISISITTLLFITHIVTIRNPVISRVSESIIVIGILLIAGKFFNMFPLTPYYTTAVLIIGLLTYAVVLVVSFVSDQASAKKINSVIQSKSMEERQ